MLIGIPGAGKSTYAKSEDSAKVIIFDGIFINPQERARAISIAKAAGLPIQAIWFTTTLEQCLKRNAMRSDDRKVPEATLRAMHEALSQNPPRVEEGYTSFLRL
jgi:predicted kinase